MASALHRTTGQLRRSVDVTELPGSPDDWIIHPDLSRVRSVARKFWKIDGDQIRPMTDTEKSAIRGTDLARVKASKLERLRDQAVRRLVEATSAFQQSKAAIAAAQTDAEVEAVELPEES